MASYRIDTDHTVEYINADSLAREDGYLILVLEGDIVAVFSRWNSVILEADGE